MRCEHATFYIELAMRVRAGSARWGINVSMASTTVRVDLQIFVNCCKHCAQIGRCRCFGFWLGSLFSSIFSTVFFHNLSCA